MEDNLYSVGILDKWIIHVPGRMNSLRFHQATQNSVQFKTYKLFISEIFHWIFSEHGQPWVIETTENKTVDKGGNCNNYIIYLFNPHVLTYVVLSFWWGKQRTREVGWIAQGHRSDVSKVLYVISDRDGI